MASTIRRVTAVGTMAVAGVGALAGSASASQPAPHPAPHPVDRHCHVEKKVVWTHGHWEPGHWVPGHWDHGHWVHGYRTHAHWVPGHPEVKKEVICDVWGPGQHPHR